MTMKNERECKDVILAMDVASCKTGYAIYQPGKMTITGTWKLNRKKWRKDLFEKIDGTIEKYGVTKIVAEDIFKSKDERMKSAYEVLAQCRGIVECVAEFWDITEIAFIRPITVKQHMWGMRYNEQRSQQLPREKQKEMMIRAVTRLGYKLENDKADDEADAIGLLITYLEGDRYRIQHQTTR
jgi:Holliday junction resolvasome RuvABC endonuclease subunit